MAGPLSGIGAGQQVPLNQTVSQGQNNNNAVRAQEERQQQQNRVQPQNAAAAESQESNNSQDFIQEQLDAFASGDRSSIDEQTDRSRGSIVDIAV